MSAQNFAALLAQVIPVFVVAIVLEAHLQHEVRIKRGGGPTGRNDADLYFQMLNFSIMAFLEVAALIAAKDAHPPALIKWIAGLPGAITVGILGVVMAEIYIVTLVEMYQGLLWNPGRVMRVTRNARYALIVLGVIGIIIVSI
ncbi:hypothetical protein ACH4GM_13530 [Streptomyces coeruleorubidus]|uniref:hypothetical protein n=1 Tax=Streptomyces coeruleorubidus TaxID=116188 RepID=UPI0037AF7EE0